MLQRWEKSHVLLSVRSVLDLDTSAIRLHPASALRDLDEHPTVPIYSLLSSTNLLVSFLSVA